MGWDDPVDPVDPVNHMDPVDPMDLVDPEEPLEHQLLTKFGVFWEFRISANRGGIFCHRAPPIGCFCNFLISIFKGLGQAPLGAGVTPSMPGTSGVIIPSC